MRKPIAGCLVVVLVLLAAGAADASRHHPKPVKPTRGKVAGSTYNCDAQAAGAGPVNVAVTTDGKPAVFISAGCPTGSTFVIRTTNDCVHVHAGATGTFHVTCTWTGHNPPTEHQDGVQVMGGHDLRFPNLHVGGALSSSQNGGIFCNGGSGGHETPTNVVVDGGNILSNNTAVVKGPNCHAFTVENATLRGVHNGCYRHKGDAIIAKNNTCLP